MAKRPSFAKACAQYVNRYTMEHVPSWALEKPDAQRNGDPVRPGYYAPQFRTDREWYEHTLFKGDPDYLGGAGSCDTRNKTWPLGHWLDKPYRKGAANAPAPKVLLGFTVELSEVTDSVATLWALLRDHAESVDDFLLDSHVFEVIAETLTDGSVKRSIRVRPAEPV